MQVAPAGAGSGWVPFRRKGGPSPGGLLNPPGLRAVASAASASPRASATSRTSEHAGGQPACWSASTTRSSCGACWSTCGTASSGWTPARSIPSSSTSWSINTSARPRSCGASVVREALIGTARRWPSSGGGRPASPRRTGGRRAVPDATTGELWRVDRRSRHRRMVPAICRFYGIVIAMFFDDHGHPHFHARHSGYEARSGSIRSRSSRARSTFRQLRLVLGMGRAAPRRTARELTPRASRWDTEWDRTAPMIGLTPQMPHVAVVRHGVLRLRFADGVTGEVDVLERMRGPWFQNARTEDGFARARLDPESGTVIWPGGADLAPDTLYAQVSSGPVAWTEPRRLNHARSPSTTRRARASWAMPAGKRASRPGRCSGRAATRFGGTLVPASGPKAGVSRGSLSCSDVCASSWKRTLGRFRLRLCPSPGPLRAVAGKRLSAPVRWAAEQSGSFKRRRRLAGDAGVVDGHPRQP